MAEIKRPKRIEWMCTNCGRKETRSETMGRPMSGVCPRKTNKGPHRWVKNRTM